MVFRRAGALIVAGAVAMVPVVMSEPAHAATNYITIQKVRSGASSIVAGSGQKTEFTVTIRNSNNIVPLPVFFADRLEDGLSIDEITTSDPAMQCAQVEDSSTDFFCLQLFVPRSSEVSATVTAHAPAATRAGVYDNCAGLGLPPLGAPEWPHTVCNVDLDSGLPEVHAQVTVTNDADLAVTAATSPSTINPGQNAVVDVATTNNGPSDADGPVTARVALATGLTFVDGSAPWTCGAAGQDVTCEWDPGINAPVVGQFPVAGTFPAGTSAPPLQLTVATARPATVGAYDVPVTVDSETPDSVPTNNTSTARILVTPVDLAISKTPAGTFQLNKNATWNVTVSNVGTIDDAAQVTVTDTLAAGLQYVSATGAGWICGASGQTVACTSAGLPIGSNTITIVATVNQGKASFANTATVATGSYEQNTANNSTTVSADATPVDLALTKTAVTTPTRVGDQGSWKLTVRNVGTTDDAGAITVTDTFPVGQGIVSAVGEGWNCGSVKQVLTCDHTHPTLAAGASEEIVVTTNVLSGAPAASNEATVATTSYEQNLANNTGSASMAIAREPQSAAPLPKSPRKVLAGRTDQGQKIKTRVLCRPVRPDAAGEASFCKVTRKGKFVRVKVIGDYPMKVRIIQTAKGTKTFKPFRQMKTYIVKPS